MAQRVSSETIKKISTMGMARALKEAETSTDPEFKEAIRRYYPHAKFGAKTAAQATKDEGTQQRAANREDVKFTQQQRNKTSSMQAAIQRRVEPTKKTFTPKRGARESFSKGLEVLGGLFSSDNSEAAKEARRKKKTTENTKRDAAYRKAESTRR